MSKYLDQLKMELATVRAAKQDVIANGQSVSIQGAFSANRAALAELNKEEARLLKLIAAASGLSTRRSEAPYYG